MRENFPQTKVNVNDGDDNREGFFQDIDNNNQDDHDADQDAVQDHNSDQEQDQDVSEGDNFNEENVTVYDEFGTPILRHCESEEDDALLTFRNHPMAVLSCSLHPTKDLAVTGSYDSKIYIWNTKSYEINEIANHKDMITAAIFNYDGNYLATADITGKIQVYAFRGNSVIRTRKCNMHYLSWLKWHPFANVLFAGDNNGEIFVVQIPSGDFMVLSGNGCKCETGELTFDGKILFAGYSNGTIKLWNLENNTGIIEVNSENPISHKERVTSVSCNLQKSLYISGSRDGIILLTDISGAVKTLGFENGGIEAVAFCPETELNIAASLTMQGRISIWDVSEQSIRHNFEELICCITIMKWLPNHTLIFGTTLGNIQGFDGITGDKKFELKGHTAQLYDIYYDKREEIILTASADTSAKLFKINTQ